MVWQDWLISISIILMGYAMIPQVIHGFRKKVSTIKLQTAFITTLTLYAMAVAFFSLKLYFSAAMDMIIGTLWLLIAVQGIIYK
jgi:predicted anti-sigma-YlaC factor YlaD